MSVKNEIDLFKREYGWAYNQIEKTKLGIVSMALDAEKAFRELGGYKVAPLTSAFSDRIEYEMSQLSQEERKIIAKEREGLRRAKSLESIVDVESFTEWGMDLIADQTANTLTMISTGGASIPIMGASAFGSKFESMEEEERGSFGSVNYTDFEKYGASFASGLFTMASEKVSLGQIKKTQRVLGSAGRNQLASSASQYYKNMFTKVNIANYGLDIGAEGISEELDNLGQNTIDKYFLGKENVNLTDNLGEGFVSSLFMSNVYKSPLLTPAFSKPYISKKSQAKIDENVSLAIKISKQLENEDLSQTVKDKLIAKRDNALLENNKLMGKTVEDTKNKTPEERAELFRIDQEKNKLYKEAREIKEDTALTKEMKEVLAKGLKEDFDALESKKDAIINNTTSTLSNLSETEQIAIKDQASRELQKEYEDKGVKNYEITDEQITAKAEDILKSKSKTNQEAKEEIRKQAKEEIAKVLNDDTLTEQQQEEKINQIVASAKVQMNVDKNDLKSPNIIFQLPTFLPNITNPLKVFEERDENNPFKKGLINLGYTDADISNMTLEQQQDILINKTQKAEVASSTKVNSVKENERQERIAELQRQLDLEVEQEGKTTTKKEVTITPETSSNYANMTEDGEGNFVFFHSGNKGYETVKPMSGDSKATSRAEAAALSKVGGMGMYYTSDRDTERQGADGAKYVVKIPKEKVYDFNNDTNNYLEEAKKRHEEEHPGKAFDLNTQVAYVTKIAGENGFDMVVSEWAGGTRAQTTQELKPVDVKEKDGARITKQFSETYVDNKEKGFESVVPESKQSKFDDLYNKIYKERNKTNTYDDLYFLAEKKADYTQDEITELINTSDISQEIKDEYNKIVEAKEQKRRSVKTGTEPIVSNGVKVKNAPDGTYIDVEMIAGKDGRKLSPEEVLDAIPVDGIEFDNDGNNLRIKLPRELTPTEMMSLMKATEQEAIGQIHNGVGKLYAQSKKLLEDYGNEFNENYFKLPREGKFIKYNAIQETDKDTLGNELESFANRIVEDGIESLSDDAFQFYAENKEALDKIIEEKRKEKPKTESKARSLALKIVEGKKDFSDAEIDLFAANEENIRSEVDSIANTKGVQITSDNYKDIIKSTKRPRKKVSTDEYAALKDQIRLEARAARGAKIDINKRRKQLADSIKSLVKTGKISTKQAQAIINRISNVNVYNEKSVNKLISYMDKVYENADYANKLSQANKLREKIKKSLKDKEATLANAAEMFSKIEPSMLDDIDTYIEKATSLKEGLRKSTKSKLSVAADIADITEYSNNSNDEINNKIIEEKAAEFQEVTGADPKDFSYEEMLEMLYAVEGSEKN